MYRSTSLLRYDSLYMTNQSNSTEILILGILYTYYPGSAGLRFKSLKIL